ncbi:hypothetical protein [Hydrogenophaga borbori]|uniref:hypothetical protein n=1 Tax=Hydrogenophaga borbori TaxID=2294117 RepID=UPI00301E3142
MAGATSYVLLEDPDGQSGYTAVATLPAGTRAYDHEVFLPARVNARYALQVCNANAAGLNGIQTDNSLAYSGAVYTFARQGSTWAQQAYVKASNPDANDQFGGSVALGGGSGGRPLTLAVGAVNESSSATGVNGNPADNSVAGSGAAYLY